MARPKLTSLRQKLTIFAVLLNLFVISIFTYFVLIGQKQAILQNQVNQRDEMVRALRQVARESILMDDDTGMVNYVNMLNQTGMTAYAMVLHPDGRVWIHSDPVQMDKTLSDEATQRVLGNENRSEALVQNLKTPDGRAVIDVSLPIYIGMSPPDHRGFARVGFDRAKLDSQVGIALREANEKILRVSFFALILGCAGAFLLAFLITRPIETLRQGARAIGDGKLDHRIQVHTQDELKELADDFNLMAQRLGELDQMKQDFVSNVTHELRSPLTSIRGYLDLLIQGTAGQLTELQTDYLGVIKNSAVRLSRFIDNLLDVAKIEAHKLKLTPEVQDVRALAHEMEVLFKPQLEQKNIRFLNEVPAGIARAFVDKDKIAEVLINLTSNAIKFTPENGEIKMAAMEGPNYLEVSLHDSGVGIPSDMVGKLFNKFEQVKSNQGLARSQKGTGLGLTIAKGIVEAHGGKIWIKSPAPWGKGTAFFFTVPKLTEELRAKLNLSAPA